MRTEGSDQEGAPGAAESAPSADVQGGGESSGFPAAGQLEHVSYNPTGGPGVHHWQEGTITNPGLDDRSDVFFAAIEMTRMPMVLTDPNLPDNPIVFANRAFQDLTGYTEEETIGRNCRFLQGAQTDRAVVSEFRAAVAEQRAISAEVLNYKRDGSPFWNAVFIAPVFAKSGELLYFFASQLDVTRRHASEQALRQAQKMEAIGQLTAGLAHDFNNMLQVVSGNLDLAMSRTDDERLRRPMESARRAAERGAKLTKQLLAFARKTRLEPKLTNLNSLLLEFGDVLKTTVGDHVELEFSLKPRVPACLVDPVHLEIAVLNVVINARDAMPNGGTITIRTEPVHVNEDTLGQVTPGDYVALSIKDDGEGMSPQVLQRATEPFFTTKEQGKGTGLGLAMVQGFVQQSLGKLDIVSDPGRGTTVRMLFPVTTEGARQQTVPLSGREQPSLTSGTETVLVVEDNEDVLALAHQNLNALGYSVLLARNAQEAWSMLEQEGTKIDLLFTDLVMPGSMNGLVLAQQARERVPDLAILLTTGYNEELLADGPDARGWDVLGKPYRQSELADRVRSALNKKNPGPRIVAGQAYVGPRHEG